MITVEAHKASQVVASEAERRQRQMRLDAGGDDDQVGRAQLETAIRTAFADSEQREWQKQH
jgi:predicted lipoprotein